MVGTGYGSELVEMKVFGVGVMGKVCKKISVVRLEFGSCRGIGVQSSSREVPDNNSGVVDLGVDSMTGEVSVSGSTAVALVSKWLSEVPTKAAAGRNVV